MVFGVVDDDDKFSSFLWTFVSFLGSLMVVPHFFSLKALPVGEIFGRLGSFFSFCWLLWQMWTENILTTVLVF